MQHKENCKVLIIGANGSMGKRYQAILKHLDISYWAADKGQTLKEIVDWAKCVDRIILCTPTESHFKFLQKLIPLKKPILCEKPITKDMKELEKILSYLKTYKCEFHMVMQYSELVPPNLTAEKSSYNYFRTGNDGLVWDCLQIIALSKGEISIENTSPVWKFAINGYPLNIKDMDSAYVNFIRKWLTGNLKQNLTDLKTYHEKTAGLYERNRHNN